MEDWICNGCGYRNNRENQAEFGCFGCRKKSRKIMALNAATNYVVDFEQYLKTYFDINNDVHRQLVSELYPEYFSRKIMAAAPQPPVPFFVLSQDQFVNLAGNKDNKIVPISKFKCFVNIGETKREIWFQSREQALRFRDMLTEMQFGTWNFEVKEEISIWKNM